MSITKVKEYMHICVNIESLRQMQERDKIFQEIVQILCNKSEKCNFRTLDFDKHFTMHYITFSNFSNERNYFKTDLADNKFIRYIYYYYENDSLHYLRNTIFIPKFKSNEKNALIKLLYPQIIDQNLSMILNSKLKY